EPREPHLSLPPADPLDAGAAAGAAHRLRAPRKARRPRRPAQSRERGDPPPDAHDDEQRHLRRAHGGGPPLQGGRAAGARPRHHDRRSAGRPARPAPVPAVRGSQGVRERRRVSRYQSRNFTETSSRKPPNARRSATAGSAPASLAPSSGPTSRPTARIAAYVMFIWPRLWYSSAPRIPTGRSRAGSDVPFAVSLSNPASRMGPGMTTIAPPTPNNPETTPATKPISATSTQVIALSSLEGVRSPATAARSLDAEHVAGLEARTHLGRQRRAVQQRAAGRAARP